MVMLEFEISVSPIRAEPSKRTKEFGTLKVLPFLVTLELLIKKLLIFPEALYLTAVEGLIDAAGIVVAESIFEGSSSPAAVVI
jgi:hypothetical protein